MYLTEKDIIRQDDSRFEVIKELCQLSKNLYNASLYDVRQHYFNTKQYKTWQTQRLEFVKSKNIDYYSLNSHIAGEVLMQVGRTYLSFFKNQSNKGLPRYKDKNGYNVVTIPKLAISKKVKYDEKRKVYQYCLLPQTHKITIESKHNNLHHVKFTFNNNHIVLYKTYEVELPELVADNERYASIDLGLNNIAAVMTNIGIRPLLYNGRPIKSINQYYNKRLAKLKSELSQNQYSSKQIKRLTQKRNNKINYELHNISKHIVEFCVENQISKLIIGKNKKWKDSINIGKKNNQKFVGVPHARLIDFISYKAKLVGISVVITEENYTSKCSAFDLEKICKHETYLGKRKHRGLFIDGQGRKWNADINGALNIMRKVADDVIIFNNQSVEGFAGNPLLLNI